MLDWEQLRLPSGFVSISPDVIDIGQGEGLFTYTSGEDTKKTYFIENSFAFYNHEIGETVFGYTALFPGESNVFDGAMEQLKKVEGGLYSYISDKEQLPMQRVGDLSTGITGITDNGLRIYAVMFRLDEIGAWTFILLPDGNTPSVIVEHVAQVFADSISHPFPRCSLVSITPVEGATWPSYDFVVEGFYPGERRMIALTGDVEIDGETQPVVTGMLGETGETVDSEGRLEGSVTFSEVAGEDVVLPDEFEFSIMLGTASVKSMKPSPGMVIEMY
jgi:hypothetical protein